MKFRKTYIYYICCRNNGEGSGIEGIVRQVPRVCGNEEEIGGIRQVPRVCGITGELGRRKTWRLEEQEGIGSVLTYCP
jgi:hypothetical protein